MNFDKLITSSVDPTKLSLTIRGFLVALIPLIIVFTGLSEADVNGLVDGIVNIVFLATSLYSAGAMVVGLLRKAKLGRWSAE